MYGLTRHLKGCRVIDCSCEVRVRARGGYVNAALLAIVALFIAYRAYERYFHPTEIMLGWMMAAAALGGLMNWWQHKKLHGHGREISRYWKVFFIGVVIFVMEMAVALWSGSLALESDAWHVLLDNGAVIVSLLVAYMLPERKDRSHVTHDAMSAHIWGDLWQSAAVVAGGAWIWLTGQYLVDVLLSLAIACALIVRAVKIARDSRRGAFAAEAHHHH